MRTIKQFWKSDLIGECNGCGLRITGAYDIPGLPGIFCSVACAETVCFGQDRCRWCGADTDRAYTSIESRLCSDDCRSNYREFVSPISGDGSAKLGRVRQALRKRLRFSAYDSVD